MSKLGIIVTVRLKSSRIPEKALQKIAGKTAIEILLNNLISDDDMFPVILAIPENSDDDILKEIGESKGVEVYRGQDESPLHRLYYCAKHYGFENVVRITCDDILIDQLLMRNMIKQHLGRNRDYTFMRRCPEGVAGEVIKTSILQKIVEEVGEQPIEFVSYYIKRHYKAWEYYPDFAYQFPYRCTMDYPEDLTLLRIIFGNIPEPIGTLDIIHYLRKHPIVTQINRLPTLTLYTSVFNNTDYIIDCLKSIVNQNYQDWELIIIDDYSEDNGPVKILEYYSVLPRDTQAKIKILRNKENRGLPANCNSALTMARGKYIMRVDSDDVLEDGALDKFVEAIKLNGSQAVISAYTKTDYQLNPVSDEKASFAHAGCALMSRWTANEIKFRDGINYLEGQEFFKRFQQLYKTTMLDTKLWKYRQHPESKTEEKEHPDNNGI